jgi:2-polyprenyl-3-methyl-5-hydroxy-6-metoxy-1,4-benzoquinol methylase
MRACPLCAGRQFKALFKTIQKCQECGLSFVNPIQEFRGENETQDYFLNEYLPLHLANRENSLAERRTHISTIRKYFRLPDNARHLDIGCALGLMLQEAKAAGWQSIGVETSEFAARYAAEHTGCQVYASTLQKAALPAQSFDVITLTDVIEHVAEPRQLMEEIYRVLRPDGVVFIVTPNFASFFVHLYGAEAYGVWPEQHIVYFQPKTISQLMRKAGFRRVVTGSKDFYSDNLRRLLRRKTEDSTGIKAAFGIQSRLGVVRKLVNRIFMHVPIGDKLIAIAQK